MFTKNITVLALLAASAAAAPYKAGKTQTKAKRQDTTYTCELSGTYHIEQGITVGPVGEPLNAAGGDNGFMALSIVGTDGSNHSVNVGEDNNPIDMGGLSISKDTTGLDQDIQWTPYYNLGFDNCHCQYGDYLNETGAVDGSVYADPLFQQNKETCACSFPCSYPAEDPDAWCGVHIQQRNREGDNVMYWIQVKNSEGNEVGGTYNQDNPQGSQLCADSLLENDLCVENAVDDRDSIYISYGDDRWESASDRCSVGVYDENGWRSMDCGFSC